jgi:hypothetical protein
MLLTVCLVAKTTFWKKKPAICTQNTKTKSLFQFFIIHTLSALFTPTNAKVASSTMGE